MAVSTGLGSTPAPDRRLLWDSMTRGITDTIVVEGLRKNYGALAAVDGVSFTVADGEFFGILGPNGAGKTTTLELIEGLRRPDGGRVSVLGENPWPRNPRLLPRIGVQMQANSFFEKLTAREQLETFASLYGCGQRTAAEMLELVGLIDKADTREDRLSGGQRQRLSIACALVHRPDVVFLDEPTAGLDPQARRNLWDVLRAIQDEGRTIIYTTHYLDEAEALCDRVAIMDHGRILALGAPATLVRGLDVPTHVCLLHGSLSRPEARALPGAEEVTDDGVTLTIATHDPAPVLAALVERDALDGLSVRRASLEDVFLQLTGREYRA
jgi:ABC-2 type transport system ATP-binding protein